MESSHPIESHTKFFPGSHPFPPILSPPLSKNRSRIRTKNENFITFATLETQGQLSLHESRSQPRLL